MFCMKLHRQEYPGQKHLRQKDTPLSPCRVTEISQNYGRLPLHQLSTLTYNIIQNRQTVSYEVDSNCEAAYLRIPIKMECKVSLVNPYKSSKTWHILTQNMIPVTLGVRDPIYNESDPIDSPTIEINYEKQWKNGLYYKVRTDDNSKALISPGQSLKAFEKLIIRNISSLGFLEDTDKIDEKIMSLQFLIIQDIIFPGKAKFSSY
ncbi:unnamed protein product [Gordionus sp. m RMFG-2023]